MVDARLPDGSRVNAIIPPLALDGALLSIRRFGAKPLLVARPGGLQGDHAGDGRLPLGLHQGPAQRRHLGGHRQRQDDAAERPVGVHPRRRAGGDDRGRRRAAAPAAARRPDGDAAGEHRGDRRGHHPRPGPQRPADAARPDHHRRVPRRRGARHAPGDEHRPRRQHDDDPRQRHPRRGQPAGDDDRHGRASTCRSGSSAARSPRPSRSSSRWPGSRGGVRKIIKISEITGMEGDVISMHDIFGFKQTGRRRGPAWPRATSSPRASGRKCLERLEISRQPPAASDVRAAHRSDCLSRAGLTRPPRLHPTEA